MASKTVSKGEVIWGQISTGTKMACGAREPVAGEEGYLHFRVTISRQAFHKVVVRLDPSDTYTVQLVRIDRKTWQTRVEEEREGVYADMLSEVIYRMCNK
jgi:hypothetical protein